MTTAGGFDVAGQTIQGGDYRPDQTVNAMATALTFGPLASNSWKANALLGAVGAGSNTATNNYFYDENKSVRTSVVFGGLFYGLGSGMSSRVTQQPLPAQLSIPYFQTNATIGVTLPSSQQLSSGIETLMQNIPAFIALPESTTQPEHGGD
ncbi:hypothetical protein [Shewanella salipaludis]|uniref:Uncharacterized protein n=1 Tax=Shewanella salipaludis TaxID=2723052 RepID=A0A972JJC8_9GAMM|nr:hypothetical protein [Shewanella salipaludis]NMH64970.1 hypothetical protein [Shewanella salipaludis]